MADDPERNSISAPHFATLFKDRHERLVKSLQGFVRNRTQAEDLAATSFQKAWENRSQFRGDAAPSTWIQAIGRNAATREIRNARTARQVPIDDLDAMGYAEPDDILAGLEREEDRARLARALDRLPAASRRLLVARYVDGRPVERIAASLKVPVGTIGRKLFEARRLLRQAWDMSNGREGPMKSDRVHDITDDALKRLAAELEAGRSNALKDYLATMARFHRYSWTNSMLIHSQRPDATRVAGYHTWRDLGRSVRRGEKGIVIYAPVMTRVARDAPPSRDDQTPAEDRRAMGFRAVYVFDVSQTEGKPLPDLARTGGDPGESLERLKAFTASQGIDLAYDASIAPADGVSSGGRIRLRPNLEPADEFAVLVHELAHEILHHDPHKGRLPTGVRETQAEAVAYVVSQGIGLETRSAAADYIALYNGDATTLRDSLAAIQATSSRILSELLPQERAAADRSQSASRGTAQAEQSGPDAPHSDGSYPNGSRPNGPGPDLSDSLAMDR